MNDDLEMILKGSWQPRKTARKGGVPADIRTKNLQNTSVERYC
jgi:hypothetical protein